MAIDKKLPLQNSNTANVAAAAPPKPAAARSGKTIEEIYQKKSQLEHILLRPDTYIGSVEKHTQTLWVYEEEEMVHRSISYVPGLYKIFDEILVNAADNKQRDPSMNSVKVTIDVEKNLITVYNNGNGVPVEIHQEEGVYVPEMIFGHLLTSSNYDDNEKKTTGGRNGYGAKLTNIFSTEFVIETADGRREKKYKQVFRDNMGTKFDPIITNCKKSENWTKVSFNPDLSKFKMTELEADVVALMRKRVVDLAGTLGKSVKVELNGKPLKVKDFTDYVSLYLEAATKSRPDGATLPRIASKFGDRWEVCVSLSEGQFQQVSFVNGIATIKGGTHVDYVTNQISNHIMAVVNKKKKNANVKAHTVKNHLWVFVNSMIDNPAFDSQTKETLTTRQSSFGSKCELTPDFLKKVEKSGVVESLLSWADFKQSKDLKKTDGAKKQRVVIEKLEDANDAGGKNSEHCTLILTEGDSAKALAMAGINAVGRDRYGAFPLRGKLLNVREASHDQLMKNAEIQHIKQILGLQQGKSYDSVKSLRYGHLMIMTDQDHDGSHIKGLLINFIHSFWPSLLKIPSFLVEFITPIVKASHRNGKKLSFYTMPEYESWRESLGSSASGWTIKYYKGLGTSTAKEGKEYFSDLDNHKKDFVWEDGQDDDAIELAFSKKKIEARKNWLRQFEPGTFLDQKEKLIKYRDFVNKELILFSMADLQRSIPSMVDGLKPGQRKILFCCFKRNFVKEAKVAQFSGYVSEHSAYHHGETSLAGTIIGMAQDFVGSNNINLLQPNGQFGTRNEGGKDHASARYVYTQLSTITRYLFCKDDDTLLDYQNEDGQSIEPTWYMPVIPTVLVNGSEGIGTGWSTFIPNYNPRDIVANLRRLLNGDPMEPMDPWYKGFRGTIEKSAKEGSSGASYTATGIIEEIDETTLRITELPLRRWTGEYQKFLTTMLIGGEKAKEDPFIEDIINHSDDTTVHIDIILSEANMIKALQEGLLKKFKLTTTISTSNMHLFDSNGVIKKYDTPEQVLEEFFHLRLVYYEKRKKVLLDNLENELLKLENKVRFILGVVNGEIIVNNRKRADLFLELRDKGFTPFPKKAKGAEPAVAGATNDTEDGDENSEVIKGGVRASDYEYLVSLAIGTLTLEKVQQLCAERDKLNGDVEELRKATPRSLWMTDLAALDNQLDEQDKKDAEAEVARLAMKKNVMAKTGRNASRAAPRKPRKNNTKKESPTANAVPDAMETSNSSAMETDNAPAVEKPKAKAPAKKAAARKPKAAATVLRDEEEDVEAEVASLKDRLAAYNLDSSPEQSEVMDTEAPGKKPKGRAAAARKKPVALTEISDDDEDGNDQSDDDDFEVEVVEAPPAGKKKGGGRKPAAAATAKAAAAKPPAAAKKRGAAAKQAPAGQKLITDVLKQSENAMEISPEKKVRRMRPSPFNKKSGSVLGKDAKKGVEVMSGLDEESPESSEAAFVAPARPQRANRGKVAYVPSDSDSEAPTEDSDFEVEDVASD